MNKKLLLVVIALFMGQTFDVCCMETNGQLVATLSITDLPVLDSTLIRNQIPSIVKLVLGDSINCQNKADDITKRTCATAFLKQMNQAAYLRALSNAFKTATDDYVAKNLLKAFVPNPFLSKIVYKDSTVPNMLPIFCFLAKKHFLHDKDVEALDLSLSQFGFSSDSTVRFCIEKHNRDEKCLMYGSAAHALIKMDPKWCWQNFYFKLAVLHNCIPIVESFNAYVEKLRIEQNSRKLEKNETDCIVAINKGLADNSAKNSSKIDSAGSGMYSSPLFYAINQVKIPMVKTLLKDSAINVNASGPNNDDIGALFYGLLCINDLNCDNMMLALKLIVQHKNFKFTDSVEQGLKNISEERGYTNYDRRKGAKEMIDFLKKLPKNA